MKQKVIHIYGASGSGTSTLGRYICKQLNYFFMDTDDYYWLPAKIPYTQARAVSERLELMRRDIGKYKNVVISGSLVDWGDELIPLFSLAIRIDTDTEIRVQRLKRREKEQFGNRIEKGGDMYKNYSDFIEWAREYDEGDLNMRSKAKHDEWQKLLRCRQILLNGEDTLEHNFERIRLNL